MISGEIFTVSQTSQCRRKACALFPVEHSHVLPNTKCELISAARLPAAPTNATTSRVVLRFKSRMNQPGRSKNSGSSTAFQEPLGYRHYHVSILRYWFWVLREFKPRRMRLFNESFCRAPLSQLKRFTSYISSSAQNLDRLVYAWCECWDPQSLPIPKPFPELPVENG
jgi:hypothetical protein